jgi:hypothetical protein
MFLMYGIGHLAHPDKQDMVIRVPESVAASNGDQQNTAVVGVVGDTGIEPVTSSV